MISQVLLLTRWEWYKLSRRRIPWVLLVIAMIVPQAVLWGSFVAFRFESGSRENFLLPNSLTTGLSITHGVAIILIMVLSSSVVGSEYGWGTLRTALTKGTGRWQFLASKALLVTILGFLLLLTVSVTIAISSVIATYFTLDDGGWFTDASQWSEFGIMLGKGAVGLLPYMMLGFFFSVLTSSSGTGISIALAYHFVVELIAAPLLFALFDWFDVAYDFVLARAVASWMADSRAAASGEGNPVALALVGDLPGNLHGFLVILAYVAIVAAASLLLFQRRDVAGAKGD